ARSYHCWRSGWIIQIMAEIPAVAVKGKLYQPSSFITAVSDVRHSGRVTPKVFFNLSLQSLEFCGLAAGVGYSLVGIGTMLAKLPLDKPRFFTSSRIAVANPHHETLPAAVMW